MTAPSPLLAVSAERLAAAIAETVPAGAFDSRDIAAYLIESGAVVPAASLADDAALVERVRAKIYDAPRYYPTDTADVLRALAAALEDR